MPAITDAETGVYTLRLPQKLFDALDAYRESMRFPSTRVTVFESLLVELLTAEGFWPPKDESKEPGS